MEIYQGHLGAGHLLALVHFREKILQAVLSKVSKGGKRRRVQEIEAG